jgi:hypothetical protein
MNNIEKEIWLQYQLKLMGYKLTDIQKATMDCGIASVKDFINWLNTKEQKTICRLGIIHTSEVRFEDIESLTNKINELVDKVNSLTEE